MAHDHHSAERARPQRSPESRLPRLLTHGLIVVMTLGLVPLALIAKDRAEPSPRPRVQIIPDMDAQPKFKAQSPNPLFADGRAMRAPVAGSIARGELRTDEHLHAGRQGGDWATAFPVRVDAGLLARGRERFDIYCAPCHGLSGMGDGLVARRADRLQEGTWTPPSSLHTDVVRGRAVGHVFNTITHGLRNMPAYGSQIPAEDRWAIVAYVKALQRSQNAALADVPPGERPALRQ
jgi:mono/diheme cytochrome c family protein